MLLLIVLLTCPTGFAAEKTIPISSLDTITFPEDVEILPVQQLTANFPSKLLLTNDHGTWRSLKIQFLPIPNIATDAVAALKIASAELNNDPKLIYSDAITQFIILISKSLLKALSSFLMVWYCAWTFISYKIPRVALE